MLVPFLKLDYLSFDTLLSRFDFIDTNNSKKIELNNVTPLLILESFFMNNEIVKNENGEDESLTKQKLVSIMSQDVWGYAPS